MTDGGGWISFDRPADWARWQPNDHAPWVGGALVYLSTDPLLPSCATTPGASPNPPDELGYACDWPLGSLSRNGVLVTWLTTRILRPLPKTGENAFINGGATRLHVERPGGCAAVGADETISARIPIGQPSPWSNIAVVACLRGPDLATAEAQVRAMLASATVGRQAGPPSAAASAALPALRGVAPATTKPGRPAGLRGRMVRRREESAGRTAGASAGRSSRRPVIRAIPLR